MRYEQLCRVYFVGSERFQRRTQDSELRLGVRSDRPRTARLAGMAVTPCTIHALRPRQPLPATEAVSLDNAKIAPRNCPILRGNERGWRVRSNGWRAWPDMNARIFVE